MSTAGALPTIPEDKIVASPTIASTLPTITHSASFWFGEGASASRNKCLIADVVTCAAIFLGLCSGALAVSAFRQVDLARTNLLFDYVIPSFALAAALITVILGVRTLARTIEPHIHQCAPGVPRFGRKGLIISGSSLLFVLSCCYRALNVADEGAALCRGPPSVWNMPASGRAVATVGEIALVVQISSYLDDTSRRLGIQRPMWTSRRRFTLVPVIVAECFSWTGVLTGISRFYCCEYVMWMLIALTWTWDSAELLHKSTRFGDTVAHAALLMGGLGLLCFNGLIEIPHFFRFQRDAADLNEPLGQAVDGVWECLQDRDSAIWIKRLPFFFSYFFGCSWGSVAVNYRYFCRGHGTTRLKSS